MSTIAVSHTYRFMTKALLQLEHYNVSDEDIEKFCRIFEKAADPVAKDMIDMYTLLAKAVDHMQDYLFHEKEYDDVLPENYLQLSIDKVFNPKTTEQKSSDKSFSVSYINEVVDENLSCILKEK